MKKFLALLLVFALLCSAMLLLASCDDGNNPAGDDPNNGGTPTPDGTIDIITDPKDPEAGGESDDNYIRQ